MIESALFIISLGTVAVMNMPADAGVPCDKITVLGAVFIETSCLTQSVTALSVSVLTYVVNCSTEVLLY
jgi:hypothetical protein